MKRKILKLTSLLLTFLMVISASSALFVKQAFAETNDGYLTWDIDIESGVLTISGSGAMPDFEMPENTPWYEYYGIIKIVKISSGVTRIGNFSFSSCNYLTSVTIGNSVVSIESNAFAYCVSLESITIPDSVIYIGERAFYGCHKLKSITVSKNNKYFSSDANGVLFDKDKNILIQYPAGNSKNSYTIPNSVMIVYNDAFDACSNLNSVNIPDSVMLIGEFAFNYCSGLNSVNIPDSVISIGDNAFSSCYNLNEITLGSGVALIGNEAFHPCGSLSTITVKESNEVFSSDENGVLFDKDKTTLLQYPMGKTSPEYTIPESVKVIGEHAFYECFNLESVTIPDSVTKIGEDAFKDTALYFNQANWPGNVLYIGKHLIKAKEYVYGNNNAHYIIKSGTLTIADKAFYECENLSKITTPNGLTNIGEYAFYGCTNLKEINIHASVTSIGESAFERTEIYNDESNWSDGVLYIDKHLIKAKEDISGNYTVKSGTLTIADLAFGYCEDLTGVTIADSVTHIGESAFLYCSSLTKVTIPDSVTDIGSTAFFMCDALKRVTIPSSVINIGGGAFGYSYDVDEDTIEQVANFKISCYKDTASEQYAKDNDFAYMLIGDSANGDVDGNGKIDATDYILVKRHILNVQTLSGDSFSSADMDANGKLDSTDYIQIKRIMLGIA